MRRLSIDDCKAIQAEAIRKLEFPTLGVSVVVKKLSIDEVAEVQKATGGKDDAETNKEAELLVCALAIVEDDGTQTYNTAEGKDAIRLLPDGMRKQIAATALGMIGLDMVQPKNS